ncbi:DUF6376 family protein [Alkalihalophilus lindianensis]|uniref:DUF6376 family protein n=1 Tax=Alkalihalophilus lindianensis TaxID=1630542 RepID=A0ABU3X6M9_9BACI|nr:DUF6376 family protein [Alkalihalophilus lindianensis]MDV2683555.1 DUF6376 family protein [Alkalihalophilus lindianensis]
MNKKMILLLTSTFVIVTGCMQDNSSDLIHDIKQNEQEGTLGAQRFSNNTDQNRVLHRADTELLAYAKEAAFYLEETINHFEVIAPILQQKTLNNDSKTSVLSTIHSIKNNSERFHDLRIPHEFEGFHQIHLSFITELTNLERVIDDMREPIDSRQAENARVHYENIMMAHKLMEREYMSLAEEYGFY